MSSPTPQFPKNITNELRYSRMLFCFVWSSRNQTGNETYSQEKPYTKATALHVEMTGKYVYQCKINDN